MSQERYDLEYYIGNKHIETVAYDISDKMCTVIQRHLRKHGNSKGGNYKDGHFKLKLR